MKGLSSKALEMAGVNKELPSLYLMSDRLQTEGRPLPHVIEEALKGGVRIVQLREKDLSARELLTLARDLRELTFKYDARLLINDRIDVALAADADGVHLPSSSFSVEDVRLLLGEDKIIGFSAHSLDEAKKAEEEGVDFVTFSPVYFTLSKANYGEPQGLKKLKEVVQNLSIPVYGLGGIKAGNIEEVIRTGAHGVALISAIMGAENIKGESEKLIALASQRT